MSNMSNALAGASRLKPEIRLAQAISHFEADLSSEQKDSFRRLRSQSRNSPPDTSDVMRFTAEIDRRLSRKGGGGRCFGPRLTNFLKSIQAFASLGDIVVGGSQNIIACGVWSVVRTSLLLIINFSSYLEKLTTLLMTVGRSAPRHQMLALLYPRSKHLQSHLSEYFIVVVRLCHQLLEFTKKSTVKQLASTLNDSDMKTYQSELDLWANMIKEEVNILMAKKIEEEAEENSRSRGLSMMFSKSISLQRKVEAKLRLLSVCSTYDHVTTWKQARKVGNATLFNNSAKYEGWKGRPDSSTLIYKGKLGSGKSILLANIVDDLNLHIQSKDLTVAYFFCRHDIPESLKARTVIGSLARQLLYPISDLAVIGKLVDAASQILDLDGIFSLLQRALPPNRRAYFILDGLDECEDAEREVLNEQLRKLQKMFPLLLCVSFRLELDNTLRLGLKDYAAVITTSIPDENPDIEAFIGAELESCIKSKKLVVGNPTLVLEIQDVLLEKSQGMFLWVALQIESLCMMKTDYAIYQALADLPKTLSETFSRILRRSEGEGKPYQRLILELVTVAHRPLTTKELREALSVVPGEAVWNPAKLLNDVYSTLACCGSLVTVDEDELTVRLVHHSVKQYLMAGLEESTKVVLTVDNAKRKMADIIVTYLNYGVFETQLCTTVVPTIMTSSAPSTIIRSALHSSSSVQKLALRLLSSTKRPDYDIGKTLTGSSKLFSHRSVDEFHFYHYADSYWLQHVLCITGQEPVVYNLLLRLLRSKAVSPNATFEDGQILLSWAAENRYEAVVRLLLETWRVESDWDDASGDQTALLWAARNGHEVVVKLLLEKDAEVETQGDYGRIPVSYASQHGHEAVVKLLLEKGVKVETKDHDGRTPLSYASGQGHEAVVKLLLEKGVRVETEDHHGRTPLSYASEAGHETVVKQLLGKGAKTEFTSSSNRTPLSYASEEGHEAVVKLLLEKGAEVETNSSGQKPLSYASQQGNEAVVKLLLEKGAKLEAKDYQSRTPLSYASEAGHEAVVKLLLEKGAELETKDINSRTPLSYASEAGHETVVKQLLGKGAKTEFTSSSNRTPLSYASEKGHEAIVKLLLEKGAEVETKGDYGRTPLSYASQHGHEAVVKLLLEKGAELETKDINSRTPLSYASRAEHKAVVNLLREKGARK